MFYILIHEESVFAIYGSKLRKGNQLAAILCKKWWRDAYNNVQCTHYTIFVFASLCCILLLNFSVMFIVI